MKPPPPPRRQKGVALLALLVMILLASSYAFYRSANLGGGQNQERETLLRRLAQAREAIIAYAVNDASRPGRLLCPDLIGDGNSPMFTQDDCGNYGGRIPWSTLKLAEYADPQGVTFRYHLSPAFGGKSINKIVNSDTPTSLHLDVPIGEASNDIAAVIIATRGAPDPRNADGDDYFFNYDRTNEFSTPEDNDIVIAITRQELMAAVEQRIANELRTCLDQHSSSVDNPEHTYPWPAPLSNDGYKGSVKSLFGMLPDTQPGNPDQTLTDTIVKLTTTKNTLASAQTVDEQLAAVYLLQDQTAYARALFDRLYLSALDLSDKATKAKADFSTLDSTLVAVTDSKASYLALNGTLPGTISNALPSLQTLNNTIQDNGFDLFTMEMQLRNAELKASIDIATSAPTKASFSGLITPINELKNNLLEYSWTPNIDINQQLNSAMALASTAATSVNAARATPAAPITQKALADALALYNANQAIVATIRSLHSNVDAEEVSARSASIVSSLTSSGNELLVTTLTSTQVLVKSISTSSATILNARLTTLSALEQALTVATTGSDQNQIHIDAQTAATRLDGLAVALRSNSDNVTLETLKAVASALGAYQQTPPPNVTTARDLRSPAKTAIYWTEVAISQSADLARLARKGITAQNDSDASAYSAARKMLDSLDGSSGTITALTQYKANASQQNAAQVQNALSNTLNALNTLLNAASKLESTLESGIASASIPPVWYGNACLFLKPSSGAPTWWTANEWKKLFFYQISSRIRPPSGQLSVNGSGSYRAVAISAGKALPNLQNRLLRNASSYLEKINGDTSRNGDAQNPSTRFVTEAISPAFNDRLAY